MMNDDFSSSFSNYNYLLFFSFVLTRRMIEELNINPCIEIIKGQVFSHVNSTGGTQANFFCGLANWFHLIGV